MHTFPSIDCLQCFCAAARHLNFRRAAATVHLSPSAFGQRIRQLEEHLNTDLFSRTTHEVRLTSAGSRLYPEATNLLASLANWPSLVSDTDVPIERSLVLGTRHELGLSWITPMLPALEEKLPGLTLHLHFGSGNELLRLVEAGTIDMAVSSSRLTGRSIAYEVLHEERYMMVASPHLTYTIDAKNIEDQEIIDTDLELSLLRYWLDAKASRSGLQFPKTRALGTIAAVRDYVATHEGVAVLPEYFAAQDVKAGRLRHLFPKQRLLTDHFRLLYLPRHPAQDTIKEIAKIMATEPLR